MAGSRSKVKTGCRTCKVRKVKCDETFPECTRCLHAGRLCGGYGIWGGGSSGNTNHIIRTRTSKRARHPPEPATTSPTSLQAPQATTSQTCPQTHALTLRAPPPLISSAISTARDREIFDYYLRLASPKLPGSFSHDFWAHAVIPATLSEPAVLHAVLALSCTHKRGVLMQPRSPLAGSVATTTTTHGIISAKGELETLALKHYVKAIGCLKPHFEAKDVTSVKIALVVCVVFTALDSFAGRWEGARRHLETGLRLLREAYAVSGGDRSSRNGVVESLLITLDMPRTMVDRWLIQVFASLQIQFGLFSPLHGPFLLPASDSEDMKQRAVFEDLLQAWHDLQRLLIRAMHLESVAKSLLSDGHCNIDSTTLQSLMDHQQGLQKDVKSWLLTMQASSVTIAAERANSFETRKAYHVVMAYHSMVTIKTETCLRHIHHDHHNNHPNPEIPFTSTSSISQFHTLLTHLCTLWSLAAPPPQYHMPPPDTLSHDTFDTLRSMMDFGWIPLLHFLATKCRVSLIRRHALGFLHRVFHREGIWDGRVIAAIAAKIIETEESGVCRSGDQADRSLGGKSQARGAASAGISSSSARRTYTPIEHDIPRNLSIAPTLEDLHLPQNKPISIDSQLVDNDMSLFPGDAAVQSITLIHTIILPPAYSSPQQREGPVNYSRSQSLDLDFSDDNNHDSNYSYSSTNATSSGSSAATTVHQRPRSKTSRRRVQLAQYDLRTGSWNDFF